MGRWHTHRFRSHKHNFHPPFILCLTTEDRFIVHDPVNISKNDKNLTEECWVFWGSELYPVLMTSDRSKYEG